MLETVVPLHSYYVGMSQGEAEAQPSDGLPGGFLYRTFRAFRYRDFRLMWLGAFTSTVGTWTQMVAQSWLVYEMTGSAFFLGATAFLAQVPFILFTLLGGAIADRIDRRKLLLFSQFVQMASAMILAGLIFAQMIAVWHFMALAFIVGTAQAFGGPAYQALLPGLVQREDTPNAIALNSIQFNLSRLIGPLLAGFLLAQFGAAFCFAFNGVSFLAVIASLRMIQATFLPPKKSTSVLRDIADGFGYVFRKSDLRQLTILGFVSSFCAVPLQTLLPVFARQVFGLDAGDYSYMMAFTGAGAVCGALVYANFSQMRSRGLITLRLQLFFALILTTFALSNWLPLSFALLFLSGASMLAMIASINSLVQLAITDEVRGRVMSIFILGFRGGMPLGDLTAGSVAAAFSPSTALILNSCLLAGVSASFLLSRSRVKSL